jgi:hypothetical protein
MKRWSVVPRPLNLLKSVALRHHIHEEKPPDPAFKYSPDP